MRRLLATFVLALAVVSGIAGPTQARQAPTLVAPAQDLPPDYAFVMTNMDGSPVRLYPCEPITWGIAAQGALRKDIPLMKRAFTAIAGATGLTFEYVGVRPATGFDQDNMAALPDVDISVSFIKHPNGARNPAGLGGFSVVVGTSTEDGEPGPDWALGGHAWFNGSLMPRMTKADRWSTYLHELGHVVGLDHTSGRNIMHPSRYDVARFSSGDLAGLRMVGRQPQDCAPGAPVPTLDPESAIAVRLPL